jgi:hypothetical protein
MDSNKIIDLTVFYYPFNWKNPWIYIIFCAAICVYVLIFFVYREDNTFGILERSIEFRVFLVFFLTTLLFHFFRSSYSIQQVESSFFRGILLLGALLLAMVFMLFAWVFNKYDNYEMNTYMRILPFKNSPYIKIKDTLIFNNIKAVKYYSGIDTNGSVRFVLSNGQVKSLGLGDISRETMDIFLVHLYEECSWLQDSIEKEFGPIERRKKYIEGENKYVHFNLLHILWFIFSIWGFFIEVICLIIYTFKINVS